MSALQDSIARLEAWRAEYGDGDGYPCVRWSDVRAALDALVDARADLASHADALSELVVVVPAGGGYLSKRAWDALEMARHVLGREELSASEAEA